MASRFGYNLHRSLDDIRPFYTFDVSCQGTVPQAVIAFLEADTYEDAIRTAISLGGDSDTLACITEAIAEAYYGSLVQPILAKVKECLTADLGSITEQFCRKYS